MQKMAFDRQTAIKASIAMLLSGKYVVSGDDAPNHLLCEGAEISRANVLGVVVSKESSDSADSASLLLDDSTGRLSVRSFEENKGIDDIRVGDIAMIIGKPREYGGEVFLAPEIVKKIDDPRWIEVRRRELDLVFQHKKTPEVDLAPLLPEPEAVLPAQIRQAGDSQADSAIPYAEEHSEKEGKPKKEAAPHPPQDDVLTLIKTLDKGDGADFDSIVGCSTQKNPEQIISTLLKNGDIFELRPGKLKVLE